MKSYGVTIQMKPLQQYFHVVLPIWYAIVPFQSADQILRSDHSNDLSLAILLRGSSFAIQIHFPKFT